MSVAFDFIKLHNGNYINLNQARSLYANGDNVGGWWVETAVGEQAERIAGGTWSTQAEAQDIIRQLVDGRSAEDY